MEYLGVTEDQLYLAVAQSKDDTILKIGRTSQEILSRAAYAENATAAG
jgi:hypothetical protein